MNSVVECTRMCFRQVWENTQENDCREERSWYRSLETGGMVWRCGGATQKQKEQEENMGKRLCCGFHQGTSEAGWEDIGLATLNIFSWRRGVGASSFSYLALVWFGQVDSGPECTSPIKEVMGRCGLWIGWCARIRKASHLLSFTVSRNWLALGGIVSPRQQGPRGQTIRTPSELKGTLSTVSVLLRRKVSTHRLSSFLSLETSLTWLMPSLCLGCCFFSLSLIWILLLPVHSCMCAQSCVTLCDHMGCSPPGSFVRGVLQARILQRIIISYSRWSSWRKDRTHVSCLSRIGRQILYHCAPDPLIPLFH